MDDKICLIYNFAHHYRYNIFQLLEQELQVDFVFGDRYHDVKKLDYSLLKNFKKEVHNCVFFKRPFYYQRGVIGLILKSYSTYLVLGDLNSISTWLLLFLAKITRKRVFLWSHGWYGKEGKFKTKLKKLFFSLATGTFLYGNYAKDLMVEAGLNRRKLHVIYNSLNYAEHIKLRKNQLYTDIYKKHFLNDHKNLIFIGRLTKQKNLELLLESLAILKQERKSLNLALIGSGDSELSLKSLINKCNLKDNVWFVGELYNEEEIAEFIYNADLCVSPGNVGLTAIHSMTYGTPVITHGTFSLQMPEFEAVIPGETGFFFEYNDCLSLANAIKTWLHNNADREKIRMNCYKIVDEKYNPFYQINIFKQVLKC